MTKLREFIDLMEKGVKSLDEIVEYFKAMYDVTDKEARRITDRFLNEVGKKGRLKQYSLVFCQSKFCLR